MSEEDDSTDESQKTEDPTPRKLEEARKRGQVINSREINNWMVLFTATLIAVMAMPSMMTNLQDLFRNYMEQVDQIPGDERGMIIAVENLVKTAAGYVLLPLILLSVAGAISGFVQTGPLFTADPISPDLSRISLLKGVGRLFSRRAMMEFVKGVIKLILVSIAGYMAVSPYFSGIEHFVGQDVTHSLSDMSSLLVRMMVAILSVLFILAVVDYVFQRSEYMKNMRMSKQEIRDEYKQTEGDPQVKARLRTLREQKARQRMMQAVPTADVVITNPTHYAVALKYNSLEMDAPVMVAKGVDAVAERIKAVAKENSVPIVENAGLARALFDSMEIDDIIPREQYKAVAEIISYVFRFRGAQL